MDDIRRPQRPPRQDYAQPAQPRPHANPNAPRPHAQPAPHPHQNTPYNAQVPQGHHPAVPVYHQPAVHPNQPHHPSPTHPQPTHHPHAQTAAHPRRRSFISKRKITVIIAVLLAAAAVFGAGYLLKSSNEPKDTIPSSITRQINYDLYFPSPMPKGYVYMKDSATFQIGKVFYKFAKGNKRVTVQEEPVTEPKPDLNLLAGYEQYDTAIGKVAMGTTFSHPTAVILTPTTVITLNTIGGVTTDELKSAIEGMKNIGQKPQTSQQ
jgi:hypothetical protein